MRYKSFDISNKKIQTLWNDAESNRTEINNLKKIEIKITSKAFKKRKAIIPLLENQIVEIGSINDDVNFEFLLTSFPTWAIPYTRVTTIFFTEEGFDVENDPTIQIPTLDFIYWWNRVDNTNYLLNFRLTGRLQQQDNGLKTIPLFANISLHIINERLYQDEQHDK